MDEAAFIDCGHGILTDLRPRSIVGPLGAVSCRLS